LLVVAVVVEIVVVVAVLAAYLLALLESPQILQLQLLLALAEHTLADMSKEQTE
jgi:hypothetical protein